jgi:hypothetical protein
MSHPELLDDFEIEMSVPIEAEAKIGAWSTGKGLKKWLDEQLKIAEQTAGKEAKILVNPTEAAAARAGIGHNQGPPLKDAPAHDHSVVLTADGQINISQSKVKTYRNVVEHSTTSSFWASRRKKKTRPLMFGSIVHEMIEAHLEGKKWREILRSYEKNLGPMFRKRARDVW